MPGETAQQNQLDYAIPVRPDDLDVSRRPDHVHVDLGPMPSSLFIATLLPHLVFPVLTVALLVGLPVIFPNHSIPWLYDLAIVIGTLPSVRAVACLSRHRHVPRSVGATPECVYYSNAATRGRPDSLRRSELSSIGVRGLWWQPRIYELVAVPKSKFFTLTSQPAEPVVLLSGLDRSTLERIAADLRHLPTSTPTATPGVEL